MDSELSGDGAKLTLDDIGLLEGTDKSSHGHDYLTFYEAAFGSLRGAPLKLLEIGVLEGCSLRTWARYFENADIVGFDISPRAKRHEGGRIQVEIGDQSNPQHLADVGARHGPFDIVIEDGSHRCDHQIDSLRALFPFVKPEGFYVVEDLHTNYGDKLEHYRGQSPITCVDYLKRWQDLLIGDQHAPLHKGEDPFLRRFGRQVRTMTFYRHACLIHKYGRDDARISRDVLSDERRARAMPVRIEAHLSFIGDVSAQDRAINEHVASQRRRFHEIQGVSIDAGLDALEYKVQASDGAWSDWGREGAFVGTRGEGRLLHGVATRLRSDAAARYEVRTTALFRLASEPQVGYDGAELSGGPQRPLYGLQIDVTPRAQ